MRKFLKLLLIVFAYTVLYMVTNAVLPFSEAFMGLSANGSPLSAVFLFTNSLFVCFTISFITKNSSWRGIKRVVGISAVVFMVISFMTQIETLFFGEAFAVLTKMDVVYIMLAQLPSIIAATLLSVRFFGEKVPRTRENAAISFSALIPRIALIGVIYVAIYFLFGYFVAWQFEEVRIFYSGSAENAGFIGQLMNNLRDNAIIYPFQFIRGVVFAICVLPLLYMMRGKKVIFMVSVCLVYLCTAIMLIIPNPLFPDAVRLAHFAEMASSMLCFGLVAGYILYTADNSNH